MTMTNRTDPTYNPGRSPEMEAFAGIEASPLVTQSLIDRIKPVNPEIQFYWGNSGAGDGLRLNQLMFAGFQLTTILDVKDGSKCVPPEMVKNGRITSGDVTCLKISKAKYFAALKHNHNEAVRRSHKPSNDKAQAAQARRDIIGSAPNEIAAKIKTFTPSDDELEKMTKS